MMHAIGLGAIVAAIGFAFGHRTAQACVGTVLILGALGFAYVILCTLAGMSWG